MKTRHKRRGLISDVLIIQVLLVIGFLGILALLRRNFVEVREGFRSMREERVRQIQTDLVNY